VLERLNSALESPPTLVLSEHEGLRFGAGGEVPVARNFRVFATMNPAEYAGRSMLSPAFRDRFGLWAFVELPGEAEVRAMLRALVHGEHPEFAYAGRLWRAPASAPFYGQLAHVPGVDELFAAFASFHASVSAATGPGAEVGRTRRERYVFTRRALLTALRLFAASAPHAADPRAALREALEQVYVERVQPGADRQAVRAALRAVGLGR
jgi:MoxR-like ATPase